jgi:hypothetical protein
MYHLEEEIPRESSDGDQERAAIKRVLRPDEIIRTAVRIPEVPKDAVKGRQKTNWHRYKDDQPNYDSSDHYPSQVKFFTVIGRSYAS